MLLPGLAPRTTPPADTKTDLLRSARDEGEAAVAAGVAVGLAGVAAPPAAAKDADAAAALDGLSMAMAEPRMRAEEPRADDAKAGAGEVGANGVSPLMAAAECAEFAGGAPECAGGVAQRLQCGGERF